MEVQSADQGKFQIMKEKIRNLPKEFLILTLREQQVNLIAAWLTEGKQLGENELDTFSKNKKKKLLNIYYAIKGQDHKVEVKEDPPFAKQQEQLSSKIQQSNDVNQQIQFNSNSSSSSKSNSKSSQMSKYSGAPFELQECNSFSIDENENGAKINQVEGPPHPDQRLFRKQTFYTIDLITIIVSTKKIDKIQLGQQGKQKITLSFRKKDESTKLLQYNGFYYYFSIFSQIKLCQKYEITIDATEQISGSIIKIDNFQNFRTSLIKIFRGDDQKELGEEQNIIAKLYLFKQLINQSIPNLHQWSNFYNGFEKIREIPKIKQKLFTNEDFPINTTKFKCLIDFCKNIVQHPYVIIPLLQITKQTILQLLQQYGKSLRNLVNSSSSQQYSIINSKEYLNTLYALFLTLPTQSLSQDLKSQYLSQIFLESLEQKKFEPELLQQLFNSQKIKPFYNKKNLKQQNFLEILKLIEENNFASIANGQASTEVFQIFYDNYGLANQDEVEKKEQANDYKQSLKTIFKAYKIRPDQGKIQESLKSMQNQKFYKNLDALQLTDLLQGHEKDSFPYKKLVSIISNESVTFQIFPGDPEKFDLWATKKKQLIQEYQKNEDIKKILEKKWKNYSLEQNKVNRLFQSEITVEKIEQFIKLAALDAEIIQKTLNSQTFNNMPEQQKAKIYQKVSEAKRVKMNDIAILDGIQKHLYNYKFKPLLP